MLRLPDGKVFLLAEVEDDLQQDDENQELMDFLEQRSQEPGTDTLDQVRAKLGLSQGSK